MFDDAFRRDLAVVLATALLHGPWTQDGLAERGASELDRWPEWMVSLAMHLHSRYAITPSPRTLSAEIDRFLSRLPDEPDRPLPILIRHVLALPRAPRRPALEHDWPIARIDSPPALAEALELDDGQLAWLSDRRGWERSVRSERLRNYRYRTIPRRAGPPRVIEVPKARLKEIQRWILREILTHVPPHPAAHGFTRGRSVLSHAALHTGQAYLQHFDLKDFFATVTAARVNAIFITLGYSRAVARVLTGLCTNVTAQSFWAQIPPATMPEHISAHFILGRRLAAPHLPQGAPTSPALANLAGLGLDRRLSGLGAASGLVYSRYADDLCFSGPVRPGDGVRALVASVAREEGFSLHRAKTRHAAQSERQTVCGVVVNVRPNAGRREYDELRAIVHNAVRFGPTDANRAGHPNFAAHLRGRIAWVASLHPSRGEKLQRTFDEIDWDR